MNEYKFYLKTYFLDLFAYFMCMGVLLPWMCWYPKMAEKTSNSLELELWMIVSSMFWDSTALNC